MVLTGVVAVNLAVVAAMARAVDLPVATYTCGPILLGVQFALHRSVIGCRARRPSGSASLRPHRRGCGTVLGLLLLHAVAPGVASAPMRSSGTGSTGTRRV